MGRAVLTQADMPDVRFGSVADRTLFASDVVRFEGEITDLLEATGQADLEGAIATLILQSPRPVDRTRAPQNGEAVL